MKIRLLTDNGVVISTPEIPPMSPYPDVIVQGNRVFTIWTGGHLTSEPHYREVKGYFMSGPSQMRQTAQDIPVKAIGDVDHDNEG